MTITKEEYETDQGDLMGAIEHKRFQMVYNIAEDDEYYQSNIDGEIADLEKRIKEYEDNN